MNAILERDGGYCHVAGASEELFGWTPEDLLGRCEEDFAHPDDVTLLEEARAKAMSTDDVVVTAYRFRCRTGIYRWTEATLHRATHDHGYVLVVGVRDLEQRRELHEDLQRQASTDALTGLANRTVFMDRLRQGLRRLGRGDRLLVVFYLDLDRFKLVNDSLGHQVGDQVLVNMAERLLHFLRPPDTLARLGGDEFAIIVEDLPSEREAKELASRLVAAGRQPYELGDDEYVCTVSIGIAMTRDAQASAEGLVQEADLALYRAKNLGRSRAETFDEELRTTAVGRLGTERMLRRALDEDRLRVEYQPIIDVASERLVGVEALVRVADQDRGLLLPEMFLDAAREAGLLPSIDDWVLEQALAESRAWRDHGCPADFRELSINLSAQHLANTGLAVQLVAALTARGLSASCLQVEVTERTLVEASHSALLSLDLIRKTGIKVGLDDFGTGTSSLLYLRKFPLDYVKLDRTLVGGIKGSHHDRAVVAAIVSLAHALELVVVAEGVETSEQHEELAVMGCDRAQGFLYSPSVSPRQVDALLARQVARDQPG